MNRMLQRKSHMRVTLMSHVADTLVVGGWSRPARDRQEEERGEPPRRERGRVRRRRGGV